MVFLRLTFNILFKNNDIFEILRKATQTTEYTYFQADPKILTLCLC